MTDSQDLNGKNNNATNPNTSNPDAINPDAINPDAIDQSSSNKLPAGCVLRAAKASDKWQIQKLLWALAGSEGMGFELRLFGYRLAIILGLGLLAAAILILFGRVQSPLELVLLIVACFVGFFAAFLLYSLVLGFVFLFVGGAIAWRKYRVVECDRQIVACMGAARFRTHAAIYNLFVNTKWRDRGLGSALVNQLVQESPHNTYLVCQPKVVGFYTRLGFAPVAWQNMPLSVKTNFHIYRPHPKLWRFAIAFMEYKKIGI